MGTLPGPTFQSHIVGAVDSLSPNRKSPETDARGKQREWDLGSVRTAQMRVTQ